jgi:hypothetical protein
VRSAPRTRESLQVGSRERKRAERRKRKERGTARASAPASAGADSVEDGGAQTGSPVLRGYAGAEERNRAAREALEPLRAGERPTAVTVGAVVSTVIALVFCVSAVLAIAGVEVNDDQPNPVPVLVLAGVLTAMAYGMWRARYWAVLGFQTLLLLLILTAAGGLVLAGSALQALGTGLLLIGAGTLFWFMVKAMARIQMPERLPRD